MVKAIYCIQHKKRIEAEKSNGKGGKVLYKLMNRAIYRNTMENLRNRIEEIIINSNSDYLKCTFKPSCMTHKMFDNNLVAIHKIKVTLMVSKMCISELTKVLMYEFHYDYIKNKF